MGNDSSWWQPGFDDSKWATISLATGTPPPELNGHPGYACYRTTLVIPSSLKVNTYFPDSLKIILGAIDDCDQVFLNGFLIGENNRTIFDAAPDRSSAASPPPKKPFESVPGLWDVNRRYVLPVSDRRIFWDRPNSIAIRVFNQYGGGGMYKGTPTVSMLGFEDRVVFEKKDFYKVQPNFSVNEEVAVTNISHDLLIKGSVKVEAKAAASDEIKYTGAWDLELRPGESKPIRIDLPVSTDPLRISFTYIDAATHLRMSDLDSVPYVLTRSQ